MTIETAHQEVVEQRPPDDLEVALERATHLDWQEEAACKDGDNSAFFHPEGERGAAVAKREEAARAICAACPVRLECIASSVIKREKYGFWGASEFEREQALAHAARKGSRLQASPKEVIYLGLSRLVQIAK
jgi:WhiB family redox-sensing transcriptional regulator